MPEIQVCEMGGVCCSSEPPPQARGHQKPNVSLNDDNPKRSVLTYTVNGAEKRHCSWEKKPQGGGKCSIDMHAVDGSTATAYTHSFSVPQSYADHLKPKFSKKGKKLMVTMDHPKEISLRSHLEKQPSN